MAIIPKALFPNVPKLPGVPQLTRSLNFPAGPPPVVGAVIALGRLWQAIFSQPAWGIYKQAVNGPQVDSDGVQTVTVVAERQPVIDPDSFLEFGYRNESTLSDYPVQDGGFMSYDKVANPYETVIRLSKGGTKEDRKRFLDSIDAVQNSLDLYDILTPEKTYIGVNLMRFELNRIGAKGAYFFAEVDIYFREIRQVTSVYSSTALAIGNPQEPSAESTSNLGTVQGQPQPAAVTPESVGIGAL